MAQVKGYKTLNQGALMDSDLQHENTTKTWTMDDSRQVVFLWEHLLLNWDFEHFGREFDKFKQRRPYLGIYSTTRKS